ncbi:ExeM/NucH family extracellular endonuclease [Wenxinia marina]|uniref:Putative extracellular nuclease n=1 Tax=Wenxinia marina DSM 24838 TaxID=1123501 RepID=A0A0D0Q5G2_9RHOB|nr:ExeM/NucH family extracellular endonuclease [Wenxinia marina]KIQ67727.1 putative extracellular nuclease [Wenxinia marina DSM 24838]GGL77656.1 hypothetical protein GCM10011392_35200 [Wenxinia marina]
MPATDLIISEYIEGSGLNKAIEIFNGTGATIDLSLYTLELYSNGSSSVSQSVQLEGTLADGEVHVLAHSGASAEILAQADQISGSVINFNGDDAVVLRRGTTVIDAFGQVGVDPGSEWPDGNSANQTLIRSEIVASGDSDPSDPFDTSAEWIVLPQDDISDLGRHTFTGGSGPAPEPQIVITEILQNPSAVSDDNGEWFEIHNAGSASVNLSGWTISDNGSDSHVIAGDLVVAPGAYAVLGRNGDTATNGGVAVDYVYGSIALANSDDEIVLTDAEGIERDRVEYDGGPAFPDPAGASMALDDPALDNSDAANWSVSTAMFGDGDKGTPGAANVTPPPPVEPVLAMIHEVQGDVGTGDGAVTGIDDVSPLFGERVTVTAIVTADFQHGLLGSMGDFDGFYLQEEDSDADDSVATSEGIFVYDGTSTSRVDVAVGDQVRVTGTVGENFGQTQISDVVVEVLSSGNALPTSVAVEFPVANVMIDDGGNYVANLEAYEGMLIDVPQSMVVTELFDLDRYGNYVVADQRYEQFTQNNAPSVEGYDAHLRDVARGSLWIDDGQSVQNPETLRVVDGNDYALSSDDTFRMGDTQTALTGVLGYQFDEFRIQVPTGEYGDANPRPETPEELGGNFRAASINVLNFFTTLDVFPDTPDDDVGPDGQQQEPRGADTNPQNAVEGVGPTDEYDRQLAKLASAIHEMDVDVMGLLEIENDFLDGGVAPGDQSAQGDRGIAAAALVEALNDLAGAEVYAFADPGQEFVGTDAIATALLFRTDRVVPVGDMAILDSAAFLDPLNTGQDRNRAAITQTFEDIETGQMLNVSVNHLKSKGSDAGGEGDADISDGAGASNATRTAAAEALTEWLASDPTGQGAERTLVLGDFNAYAREQPIEVIEDAGYANLGLLDDPDAYSYVFDGQTGTLDYAFANDALADDFVGATEWHINADEADALDYNLEFGRDPDLYDGGSSSRYSDHDPILVAFDLESVFNMIAGTGGRDRLYGTGDRDRIEGRGGNDIILGLGGADRIGGGRGNDDIFGGSGNDVIADGIGNDLVFGGFGDDTIVASGGRNDKVSGGFGDDTFVFSAALAEDGQKDRLTILDYGLGDDVIDLGGAEIGRVRESRLKVELTLEGDGDRIVVWGVDDLSDITFAGDPLLV